MPINNSLSADMIKNIYITPRIQFISGVSPALF